MHAQNLTAYTKLTFRILAVLVWTVEIRLFLINFVQYNLYFSGLSGTLRPMYCWLVPVMAAVGCGRFLQETARRSRDTA